MRWLFWVLLYISLIYIFLSIFTGGFRDKDK